MLLVGYSDERQAFKLMNSWGTKWGDGGFGWISYRALAELSDRFYVATMPADEPPKPPPAPVVVVVEPPRPAPVVVVEPPRPAPVVVVVEPPKPPPVVVIEPPKPPPVVIVQPPRPAPVAVVEPPRPTPTPVVVAPPPPPIVVVQPPKPVAVPVPSIAVLREQIAKRAGELSCAAVQTTVAPDRTVRMSGFAGAAADMDRLRSEVGAMPGVQKVVEDVRIHPWPQCEVYLNFDKAMANRRGLAAGLRGVPGGTLRGGDSLAITVTTPAYPSYVYVSYIQASGDVVHLNWPEGRTAKALAPNSTVTFGGGANGQPTYRIGKPYGEEIVVVVTSASPLFLDQPAQAGNEREYLTSFRRAFLVQPKDGVGQRIFSAVALPLNTQP